jgi:hypothetical protein
MTEPLSLAEEIRQIAMVCREFAIRRVDAGRIHLIFADMKSASPLAESVAPPLPASQPNADDARETKRKARERYLDAMESAHTSGRGWPDPSDYGLTEAEVS